MAIRKPARRGQPKRGLIRNESGNTSGRVTRWMRESPARVLSHIDFGAGGGRTAWADGYRDQRAHGPLAVHIRCAAGKDDSRADGGLLRAASRAPVTDPDTSVFRRLQGALPATRSRRLRSSSAQLRIMLSAA